VRQVILIVLLIGAAFLGGAFVNGPGLQWAQSRVLRSLGLTNGGEIAAVDLESTSNGEIVPEPAELLKLRSAISTGPIAPMPSVASENKPAKADALDRPLVAQPQPKSSNSGLTADRFRQPSLPSATSAGMVTKSSSVGAATLDPQVMPARGDSLAGPSRSATPSDKPGAPALLDSLAALLPPGNASSDAPPAMSTRSSTGSKPTGVVGDDWALLESRMQTLGVSRFTIEGKPGGAIVFTCLIPVAGRQAVTERFEAEADDVIQAAQAALRRIILWRAAQRPHNERVDPSEENGH
jgi:hypothetical protein